MSIMQEPKKGTYINNDFLSKHIHTITDNDTSSRIYFMSIFLLFNIVDKMKFICVLSVRL